VRNYLVFKNKPILN